MTAPVLYGAPWWWESDSDPTANIATDNGFINYGNFWRNTVTNNVFICTNSGDNQNNGLEWMFMFTITISPPLGYE